MKDGDDAARLAIDAGDLLIILRPQLDARNVLQAHDRAIRIRAHGNLAELFGCLQAALGAHHVSLLFALWRGFSADLSRRIDRALLLHGARNVGNGQSELGEQVGLDPDAHGVIARPEEADFANARYAVERIVDIDVGVVRQEKRIVCIIRREQRDDEHRQSRRLAQAGAELVDIRRQIRLRLRQAVLHVDLIGVGVCRNVEGHGQLHSAVVGVGRLHVEHVIDAVHLLFDRRGDRLLDGDGVRACVGRRGDDLRRHYRRELRQRQAAHGDEAEDDGDEGDHHTYNRTIDEKSGNHGINPCLGSLESGVWSRKSCGNELLPPLLF